jgi:hypothetical protein
VIASIVSLTGPNALPSGMPFDSTTLGSAAFLPPSVSADVRVPLSVSLGPGWYGLIFSITGPGAATMPNNNTDLPGATYFFWTGVPVPCPVCPPMPFQWRDSGSQTGERFVVEGNFAPTSVPEPKAAALMGPGCSSACLFFSHVLTLMLGSPGATLYTVLPVAGDWDRGTISVRGQHRP